MSFFELKVGGANEILRLVQDARFRGQNIDQAFPIVAQLMHSAVEDVVEMEGPGWPALADSTIANRRRHGRGTKMLQDTGLMMASLDEGVGPDYAEVFFGTPYAKYHIGTAESPGVRNPFNLAPVEDALFEDINEVLLKGIV